MVVELDSVLFFVAKELAEHFLHPGGSAYCFFQVRDLSRELYGEDGGMWDDV